MEREKDEVFKKIFMMLVLFMHNIHSRKPNTTKKRKLDAFIGPKDTLFDSSDTFAKDSMGAVMGYLSFPAQSSPPSIGTIYTCSIGYSLKDFRVKFTRLNQKLDYSKLWHGPFFFDKRVVFTRRFFETSISLCIS